MRDSYDEILNSYNSIVPNLEEISNLLEQELQLRVGHHKNVDRVTCRYKAVGSFMNKAQQKNGAGHYKYEVPFKEIQDKIGARIVVYYKTDVEPVRKVISTYFRTIEEINIVPDDVSKFGYEGFHAICLIPSTISRNFITPLVGDFFELQIKTLYQHAWSQSNHGLGYKPGEKLKEEEVRLLAFIAAQSWGADRGLLELAAEKHRTAG